MLNAKSEPYVQLRIRNYINYICLEVTSPRNPLLSAILQHHSSIDHLI